MATSGERERTGRGYRRGLSVPDALRRAGSGAATGPSPARGHATLATSSTATSTAKPIVSGAAISAKSAASGSMSAILPTASSSIASTPPSAPTMTPSITNGQRMNQSVAPTSFITSTSRRRENSDRRIVLEISRTLEAISSRTASSAIVSFTTRVAVRIFVVSSFAVA